MADVQEKKELYALRSPLSPEAATERLRELGSIEPRAADHRTIVALEIYASDDPLSTPIEVEIEPRKCGSYVTARVGENAFLHDFARVARCVATLYFLIAGTWLAFHLPPEEALPTTLGMIAGWLLLLSLSSAAVHYTAQDAERAIKPVRIRHQLARILSR